MADVEQGSRSSGRLMGRACEASGGVLEAVPGAGGSGLVRYTDKSHPVARGVLSVRVPWSLRRLSMDAPWCDRSSRWVCLGNGEQWVPAPCRNRRCDRCDRREAMLLARVMWLDALTRPVEAVATLTTRDPGDSKDADAFRRAMEAVLRAVRRRWSAVEYCAHIEFTTGEGSRSGGHRRMHAHVLLRGLGGADLADVHRVVSSVWCARMRGTRPEFQPVEAIRSPKKLAHYLAHHHRKAEQRPPDWWAGRRLRPSRGWWSRPIAELRAEAAEQLRLERLLYVARQQAAQRCAAHVRETGELPAAVLRAGWDAWVAEVLDVLERARLAAPPWEVWRLRWNMDGEPLPAWPMAEESSGTS